MKLVFASNNSHKLQEVQNAVGNDFEIISLKTVAGEVDIEETGTTLEENARIKSMFIYENYGLNCFADDTGLEIEALNNEPGVYSARYAGEKCSFDDNMNKVLAGLKGKTNRKARFRTVISLILDGKEHLFEGTVNGEITTGKHGQKGFGYDPIFKPESYDKTFAELSLEVKNKISHRGKAVKALVEFLKNFYDPYYNNNN